MKKGDELILKIDSLKKLNMGQGTPVSESSSISEEPKICVKNVLPGQTLKARISKKRKGKIEAKVLEVLEPSPDETEAVCSINNYCGGCLFQALPYQKELEIKEAYIRSLFENCPISVIHPSPRDHHYRNKMEYTFGNSEKGGELVVGLHERNKFYNILDTKGCILANESFEIIREAIQEFFREEGTDFYHKNTHQGFLRYLILREGENTGEILVNLVTSSDGELDKERFVEMLKSLGLNITGILHTTTDLPADAVTVESLEVLDGSEFFTDRIGDLEFKITPFSFFQVNTKGAELLYEIAVGYVKKALKNAKAKTIFDLYSGTGTITLLLSELTDRVYGIELNEEAVEIAKENAVRNNINNVEFIAGDVFKELNKLEENPGVIVVDPPRSGITPKALKKILSFEPEHLVYISCNPEMLRKDLDIITEEGYKIMKMEAVDMFPRTPHIETVAWFKRTKNN